MTGKHYRSTKQQTPHMFAGYAPCLRSQTVHCLDNVNKDDALEFKTKRCSHTKKNKTKIVISIPNQHSTLRSFKAAKYVWHLDLGHRNVQLQNFSNYITN